MPVVTDSKRIAQAKALAEDAAVKARRLLLVHEEWKLAEEEWTTAYLAWQEAEDCVDQGSADKEHKENEQQ